MTMWAIHPKFPAYQISDDGQVFSIPRPSTRGGLRKLKLNPQTGYLEVTLSHLGKVITQSVHSLTAEAFFGPRPDGLEIRHLDGNRLNNDVRNLKYGTRSENQLDRLRHGTHNFANKTHCPHDHEYTPENTYVPPGNPRIRYCRQCRAARPARFDLIE